MKSPKIATITFTEEEARVTLNLLDAALKSLGLSACESVIVLAKKFTAASFQEVVEKPLIPAEVKAKKALAAQESAKENVL